MSTRSHIIPCGQKGKQTDMAHQYKTLENTPKSNMSPTTQDIQLSAFSGWSMTEWA
jgi:hypothetical protein